MWNLVCEFSESHDNGCQDLVLLVCKSFFGSQVFLYHAEKGDTSRSSSKLNIILSHKTSNLYCITASEDVAVCTDYKVQW
jgi:hypothetical protein